MGHFSEVLLILILEINFSDTPKYFYFSRSLNAGLLLVIKSFYIIVLLLFHVRLQYTETR